MLPLNLLAGKTTKNGENALALLNQPKHGLCKSDGWASLRWSDSHGSCCYKARETIPLKSLGARPPAGTAEKQNWFCLTSGGIRPGFKGTAKLPMRAVLPIQNKKRAPKPKTTAESASRTRHGNGL